MVVARRRATSVKTPFGPRRPLRRRPLVARLWTRFASAAGRRKYVTNEPNDSRLHKPRGNRWPWERSGLKPKVAPNRQLPSSGLLAVHQSGQQIAPGDVQQQVAALPRPDPRRAPLEPIGSFDSPPAKVRPAAGRINVDTCSTHCLTVSLSPPCWFQSAKFDPTRSDRPPNGAGGGHLLPLDATC